MLCGGRATAGASCANWTNALGGNGSGGYGEIALLPSVAAQLGARLAGGGLYRSG